MFEIKKSVLVVIDVQGKLAYLMHDKDRLFKHIQSLIKMANILEIPIIFTEQVPQKIGATIPEIADHFGNHRPFEKVTFSCCGDEKFNAHLKSLKRKQVIVCGIETHVCVYQTVSDLLDSKYEVQLVEDAVSSRTFENKKIALERVKEIGGTLTSVEMISTELLRTSTHPRFREVLALVNVTTLADPLVAESLKQKYEEA